MRERKSGLQIALRGVEALLALLLIFCLVRAIVQVNRDAVAGGRERLEDSVRRCALNCYAMEGVYPPDVGYLQEHYGLQIDTDRYTVHYTVFAENMMPEIAVTEKR